SSQQSEHVRVTLNAEILIAKAERLLQMVQQISETTRIVAIGCNALELDEVAEVIDAVEVDPHPVVYEEVPDLAYDNDDAENRCKSLSQLVGPRHLQQPVAAFLVPRGVRTLVGDQVGTGFGFLSQLQPSQRSDEVSVSLDQRPLVIRPQPFANLDRSRGIAIQRLQLKISARSRDGTTLLAGLKGAGLAGRIDPGNDPPLRQLVVGGWGRRRVSREAGDDRGRAMQVLLHRRRSVDTGMKEPTESLPISTLDRVEDIAHCWYLLCHSRP